MFKVRLYVYALFFAHLVLEKLIKAHWVKDNMSNFPPKTLNLIRLIKDTKLKFSEADTLFLRQMNDFQLEGRYPDYQQQLYKIYKSQNTQKILDQSNSIRKWLLKKLQ